MGRAQMSTRNFLPLQAWVRCIKDPWEKVRKEVEV
jgi:hypothetical protein